MAKAAPLKLETLLLSGMKILTENPLYKVGEAEIRGNRYRVFENIPPHLRAYFADNCAAQADKPFLSFQGEDMTYGEVWSQACRFANALSTELGVKKGDHVAIAMRNYPEWCVAYIAVISLGAIVVPLNSWWRGDELKFGLEDSGAKIVVVDAKRLDHIKPFREELGLTLILAREDGDGADHRYEDMMVKSADEAPPATEIDRDDRFCIVYTSGSTGRPKGVILTHRGALSTLYSWYLILETLRAADADPLQGEDASILLAIPLFHVTGSHSIFMLSFLMGRRLLMMYRWDAEEAARLINEEKVTNFVGVPSQSYELMRAAGNNGLPSLVDVGSGGAKRPPEHVTQMSTAFKQAMPSSGYGLSETNAIGCVISRELYQERPDSTGRPVAPLTDIKIVAEDGADAPRGEVGEIWIRSPANFEGYWNRPEETTQALTEDGWFKTGDLGKMDEQDFVYIVDRMKELIIRGGENISCLEVEAGAYEHEMVAEAAAFSVPDERLGELVGLVVYPRKGGALEASDLHDFMSERMAGFKVPERIWISPAPLPRLGTEKFDKLTVKQIALQHPPALSV
ncbi:MAG: class I adenylate-forming enzyme family protein [Pseudomonadota bacterium]